MSTNEHVVRQGLEDDTTIPFKKLWVPLYLPAALYSVGLGAVMAMVAVIATEYGADLATAGFISGLVLIGRLFGNIPSASLCSKIGEQWAMIAAAGLSIAMCGVILAVPDVFVLAVGTFILGMGSATFNLARQILLTRWVDSGYRGRAMSTLAGMNRFGITVGPFITAALIGFFGAESAFWLHIVTCSSVIVLLLTIQDPEKKMARAAGLNNAAVRPPKPVTERSFRVFRSNAAVLLKLGTATGLLMLLRASRQVILPLWGIAIGASDANIALAVGLSGVFELFFFYASGQLMDRFGRLAVILPVTLGLAAGHIGLLLATDTLGYYAVALALGFINSLGLGVHMTLGSDLAATRTHPAQFLGLWRLFGDGGMAVAPLLISGMTALVTLGAAAVLVGLLGAAGAAMMWRWIPQYINAPGKE